MKDVSVRFILFTVAILVKYTSEFWELFAATNVYVWLYKDRILDRAFESYGMS